MILGTMPIPAFFLLGLNVQSAYKRQNTGTWYEQISFFDIFLEVGGGVGATQKVKVVNLPYLCSALYVNHVLHLRLTLSPFFFTPFLYVKNSWAFLFTCMVSFRDKPRKC